MVFKKGYTPWNKGNNVRTNTGRTHFKFGHKTNNGRVPSNKVAIGKLAMSNGRKVVKSNDSDGWSLNSRYVWEQYNGHIPKGSVVHHIDGNKANDSIENLQLLTPKEHSKIHGAMTQ